MILFNMSFFLYPPKQSEDVFKKIQVGNSENYNKVSNINARSRINLFGK